jgi:O-antigen biosynthesis protein
VKEDLISVVIPVFNRGDLLKRAVESVLQSTDRTLEIVVVDNGSTDGTRAWLAKRQDWTQVWLGSNRGFTWPVNVGILVSMGRRIVLLNSDVEVEKGALDALDACLDEDERRGMAGPMILDMGDRNQIVFGGAVGPAGHKLGWLDKGDFSERSEGEDYLTFACVMLRREMVREIGLLDERFRVHGSDSDYCYRARAAEWGVTYEPAAKVYHWQEGTMAAMRRSAEFRAVLDEDQRQFAAKWPEKVKRDGED